MEGQNEKKPNIALYVIIAIVAVVVIAVVAFFICIL